jgi:hypothetical protein
MLLNPLNCGENESVRSAFLEFVEALHPASSGPDPISGHKPGMGGMNPPSRQLAAGSLLF